MSRFGLSPETITKFVRRQPNKPIVVCGHKPDTQNTSNVYVQLYLYTCLFLLELKDAGKTKNYCYERKIVAMKANVNNNNYSSSPNSLDVEACRFTHPLQVVSRRGLTMAAMLPHASSHSHNK
jgi:hypothetical protein